VLPDSLLAGLKGEAPVFGSHVQLGLGVPGSFQRGCPSLPLNTIKARDPSF